MNTRGPCPRISRIERARLDAYHAADIEALNPEELAAFPAERLAGAVFAAHPATRGVRSSHSALSIFLGNRGEGSGGAIGGDAPEDTLVTRPGMEVFVRRLSGEGATFLERFVSGECLGEAAWAAFAADAGFDLSGNIEAMIEAGAFSAIYEGKP